MSTITKKEFVETIAESTGHHRTVVKDVIQSFLDAVIVELGKGNRMEFRDFGVFEVRHRRARRAHNPKTFVKVQVPPRKTVRFKVGRIMKEAVQSAPDAGPDEE